MKIFPKLHWFAALLLCATIAIAQVQVPWADVVDKPTSITDLSGVNTTAFGRATLSLTDAAAGRAYFGLGNLIGTAPNQVPLNQFLGGLAYQSPEGFVIKPQASVNPGGLRDMVWQLTNDTTLVVKVRGTDGIVRTATITLAP